MNKKTSEIKVLPPRRVPLESGDEREAAALVAELLLEAARTRRGLRSASALDGASGGATGSVIPFPEKRGKAREAA